MSFGLFRSDYMVHVDSSDPSKTSVKQVEFNTIASSFGGLSAQVSGLHKHLRDVGAYPASSSLTVSDTSLPLGESIEGLAKGLQDAFKAYDIGTSDSAVPQCLLFVVQDPERNVFDQRHLEYAINAQGIRTFRLPWKRVLKDTKLNERRQLIYIPPHTPTDEWHATVVYLRAGYAPSEYESQADWDARLHLERSDAIMCPSILTHLAGTKKVQQVLATPHSPHLERFLPDQSEQEAVLQTFAPIYPLDKSEAGLEARKLATNPETAVRYVLKPQREGGGNNVYRKAIPDFLKSLPESHWPAYILMEMIEPPAQSNIIFRNGELQRGGVICELGVYGACIWRNGESQSKRSIEVNFEAGYLLRTKGDQSEEGGGECAIGMSIPF